MTDTHAKTEEQLLAQVDYLQRRVAYLEEINQWHDYAMDILSSTAIIFGDSKASRENVSILKATQECINRILEFDQTAYYVIDDTDSSFELAYSPTEAPSLTNEVDALIANGMFSWALNQNHPVCLPGSGNGGNSTVLHVISTRTRIRGMFVGSIDLKRSGTGEFALKLLSIVLFNTAYALESAALYNMMNEQRQTLARLARKQSRELLHQQSHDGLTGLPNRVLFVDRLEQMVKRHAEPSPGIAVMVIDIDNFKRINDSLGHRAGDDLVLKVSRVLSETLSGSPPDADPELRPEHLTLSRLGGDEFGIIVDGVDSLDLVRRLARSILQAMNRELDIQGHQVFITLSIGISVFPYDGRDADTLVKNADAAMYEIKQSGRNNFQFYTREANSLTYRHLVLENALINAINNDELVLFYQPQIELGTGRVVAAEALLRWNHPDRGLLGPAEFIPIAEETGLIDALGHWVLSQVCRDIPRMRAVLAQVPRIAINLSARQFRQEGLIDYYRDILQRQDIDPSCLELELTESAIMYDVELAIRMFEDLHTFGFRIAIDDFGTGYSSLNTLKHLPLDTLKIDRSFVRDVPGDHDDAAIVTAIVAMARSLELEVVAEGVETAEQLDFIERLGCHMAQGFHFSRPVPFDDFVTYVRKLNGGVREPV
ncbi:MAG: bifunctional diguanylate cyclase/phosphodiesterase [Ectothiorhodospiraceae bacterium]|jgi:diguanylate cyclase (GGDEF)-like protein|nr:bifunctional diguanylate cyclase/phosphodiesterase [Ectothiorhodospiraceae bacterium]